MQTCIRHFAAFAMAATVLLTGCGHQKKQQQKEIPPPASTQQWRVQQLSPPPRNQMPIVQGAAPLVYQLNGPASVRVVDMTDGRVIVSAPAGTRSIVAVDEKAGVTIAGQRLVQGPLGAGHRYGIYLDIGAGTDDYQTGLIKGGRAPDSPPAAPQSPGFFGPGERHSEP